MANKK